MIISQAGLTSIHAKLTSYLLDTTDLVFEENPDIDEARNLVNEIIETPALGDDEHLEMLIKVQDLCVTEQIAQSLVTTSRFHDLDACVREISEIVGPSNLHEGMPPAVSDHRPGS